MIFMYLIWGRYHYNFRAATAAKDAKDWSLPSFGSHLNPISTRGGRLCPPYTGVLGWIKFAVAALHGRSQRQNTVHTCFNWREKNKENLPVSCSHQRLKFSCSIFASYSGHKASLEYNLNHFDRKLGFSRGPTNSFFQGTVCLICSIFSVYRHSMF